MLHQISPFTTFVQLVQRYVTNKGYISKVENDIKDVRISSLLKIVEVGLGGTVELKIKF